MTIQLTRADLSASADDLGPEKAAAIMAAIFHHGSTRQQAQRTYPRRKAAQRDFVRGYEDELGRGDGSPLTGSRAEQAGRIAAIRTFGLDNEPMRERLRSLLSAPLRSAALADEASEGPLFQR